MQCSNCGHECSEGAAFCASCGKPLTDASAPTQPEPAIQVQTPPAVNAEEATGGASDTATASSGSRLVPIVIIIALVLGAVFLFNTCSSNAKQGDSGSAAGSGESEFQLWQEQQQAKPSTLGEWLNSSQKEFDAFGSAVSEQMAVYNLYGLFNGKWECNGNDIKLTFTLRAEGFENEDGAAVWQFLGLDQLTGSAISESLNINDFTSFIQKIEEAYGISGVTMTVSYVDLSGHPLFTAKFNNQGLIG